MKILLCVFGLLLLQRDCLTFTTTYNINHDKPTSRITGGSQAKPHSHPYMVSLQTRILWARAHICGGALLNENWVLTAGHCIKESWLVNWLPMDAIAGLHNSEKIDKYSQIATIDKRIAHPLYKGGIAPHDIAVLKTKTPFTFSPQIQPIQLPQAELKLTPGETLNLAGWGVLKTTLFWPDMPEVLQEVDVTYLPYDECYQAITDLDEDDNPLNKESHMCTGPITGGISACSGDSGGPLVYYQPQNDDEFDTNKVMDGIEEYVKSNNAKKKYKNTDTPVALGIVSWGISPCGEKGAPSVYTKVIPHLDFINKEIEH